MDTAVKIMMVFALTVVTIWWMHGQGMISF